MGANERQLTGSDPAEVAIASLFHEHAGQLYGMGLKMCGDPDEAEDLVQETFIRAFRSWSDFRGESSPSTWLYTIAARVCQRMHRRRAGQPSRVESLSRLLPSGDEVALEIPTDDDSPLETVARHEAEEVVREAASHLDTRYRLPLALKDLLGLSTDEVAAILELKPSTVRSRVHRARLQLAREVRRRLSTGRRATDGHPDRVCLDLLRIKQKALDGGTASPISDEELCDRCRELFASLDLTADACRGLASGDITERLHRILEQVTSSPAGSH